MKPTLRYFVSYAHADFEDRHIGPRFADLMKRLETKLALSKEFTFERWDDHQILPGNDWRKEIESNLASCDFGLILVSENLLISEFIKAVELPVFLEANRPCVPLAFGQLDFTRDLQGLQERQIFRYRVAGKSQKAFVECGNETLKNAYATALVHAIEEKMKPRIACPTPSDSTQPQETPQSPEDLEAELKRVFPEQFEGIQKVIESNEDLRALLCKSFDLPPLGHEATTLRLIVHFYGQFLTSLGKFGKMYPRCPEKDRAQLEQVISSMLFLAMNPSYAERMRENPQPDQISVPRGAKEGIIRLLIAWTYEHDGLPLKNQGAGAFIAHPMAPPGKRATDVRVALMDKYQIDKSLPEAVANQRLEAQLESDRNFNSPQSLLLSEEDKELIAEIKAPGSPLRDLLVLLMREGETIRPEESNYDERFQAHYARLKSIINK